MKAKVLVADDSPLVLRMIEKMLAGAGYDVVTARDGLEAIAEPRHGSVDILSRVNDLLDRKLYEATILSEIGRVARNLLNFDETFTSSTRRSTGRSRPGATAPPSLRYDAAAIARGGP